MTDDRDPEKTLEDWKAEMQAEHETAIADPDPDEDHRIEGVTQVSYRVYFEYDQAADELERDRREQVDDLADPELLSCSCGVRGMTREEARQHVAALREAE
ncbi:hypothetical protein BV210_07280 [Halorientalis sp. IM1011]|uniref:hypothetical protein n=1 Tax=Halorientalis sp. IM1011 TaxID=1932360 RepID=UPI00097CC83D|nr:hypothetical protein [Halorientalis sp. IM1011]AQL42524.1 hypothetical protein BV210_07280 [Halorientalis sp. IM1011]